MDIKVIVATHKKYYMPDDICYLPLHVGGHENIDLGYEKDSTYQNISKKNPYYCELTGLYWAWKNMDCEYLGLAHYRRHFSEKNLINHIFQDKKKCIATSEYYYKILQEYDIIVPKKRNYYIETLYSHYAHTHYKEHLDITREIVERLFPDYIDSFDKVMNMKSGHMFNMFVMKKSMANEYCEWLFKILFELEEYINFVEYDTFQARLFGRVSEILFNVWLDHTRYSVYEANYIHMEKLDWNKKITSFLMAKFINKKYKGSF